MIFPDDKAFVKFTLYGTGYFVRRYGAKHPMAAFAKNLSEYEIIDLFSDSEQLEKIQNSMENALPDEL